MNLPINCLLLGCIACHRRHTSQVLRLAPLPPPAARLEFDPWIHSTKGGCFIERVAPMLPNTRQEMEVYHSLAWMTDSWPAFMEGALFGANVNANTLSLITGQANTALMEEIAEAYQQYKSGAGLALSCYNIGQTDDHTEQNEILVESVGGLLVGGFSGFVLTAIFVIGPVGVVAALAIGTASGVRDLCQ